MSEYDEARALLLELAGVPLNTPEYWRLRKRYRAAWERWMTANGSSFSPLDAETKAMFDTVRPVDL